MDTEVTQPRLDGQGLVEYALIIAFVAIILAGVLSGLADGLVSSIEGSANAAFPGFGS